jgi:hypothetical protein
MASSPTDPVTEFFARFCLDTLQRKLIIKTKVKFFSIEGGWADRRGEEKARQVNPEIRSNRPLGT